MKLALNLIWIALLCVFVVGAVGGDLALMVGAAVSISVICFINFVGFIR